MRKVSEIIDAHPTVRIGHGSQIWLWVTLRSLYCHSERVIALGKLQYQHIPNKYMFQFEENTSSHKSYFRVFQTSFARIPLLWTHKKHFSIHTAISCIGEGLKTSSGLKKCDWQTSLSIKPHHIQYTSVANLINFLWKGIQSTLRCTVLCAQP